MADVQHQTAKKTQMRRPENGSAWGIVGLFFTLTVFNYLKDEEVLNSPPKRVLALVTSLSAVSYFGLLIIRDYLFIPMFILPAVIIGRVTPIDEQRNKFIMETTATCKKTRVAIPTNTQGVILDAMILEHTNIPECKRWVIWFNPNGVVYEHILEFARLYSSRLNANALVFNFRGVGKSTGWPHLATDLQEDGLCVVDFLVKKYNLDESQVLLHGHSMGGAVVSTMFNSKTIVGEEAEIAADKFKLINDRSFRSLSDVATAMVRGGLGRTMGMMLSMFLAGVITQSTYAVDEAYYNTVLPFTGTFSTGIFGFMFGGTEGMAILVAPVLKFMGWELNSADNFNYRNSMVMFHRRDGVIQYELSSLHHALLQKTQSQFLSIELMNEGQPQENHMYTFNKNEAEFERVVKVVADFWSQRRLGNK